MKDPSTLGTQWKLLHVSWLNAEWIFGSLQVVKEIKIALRKDSQIVFGFYKYLCLVFCLQNE